MELLLEARQRLHCSFTAAAANTADIWRVSVILLQGSHPTRHVQFAAEAAQKGLLQASYECIRGIRIRDAQRPAVKVNNCACLLVHAVAICVKIKTLRGI